MLLRTLRENVAEIRQMVSSINTALIVREPGTALAADAYEGLRRQVASAASDRRAHLIELVRIQEALDNDVSIESLQRLVAGWSEQAGLRRWEDPEPREFFEIIGDGDGDLELVQPAWVAGEPAELVKPGLLQRSAAASPTSSETEAVEGQPDKDDT